MALVGFDPETSGAKLTTSDRSTAGAVSSSLTRLICQPLDVAKIRLQLQVEDSRGKYRSFFHLAWSLPKQEGVAALWKGHMPAQYLSIAYGVSTFAVFEYLTKLAFRSGLTWTSDPFFKPATHFVCGGVAGCAATLVSFPFDTVRTRLVAQPEPKIYKNSADAVAKLVEEGGWRIFYRGLTPTLAAIAPYSGLQFGFYTFFTEVMDSWVTKTDKDGQRWVTWIGSLSCGGLAGLCSKTVIYPLDTVKKRLQVAGWEKGRTGMGETLKYGGMIQCIRDIRAREGVAGLFKGFVPGVVKAVSTTSLHFWFYEYVCYFIAVHYRS